MEVCFSWKDVRRWQKIGNVRENDMFCEVEMRKQNEGRNQKDIDESRQCTFDRSIEEGTKGKRNKITKIL